MTKLPQIRPATRLDAAVILRMIGELAAHHGDTATTDLAQLKRDLFDPQPWASALVAEQGCEILGYALLCRQYRAEAGRRGLELHHLYVTEKARGRGLGRALVAAAISAAREAGCGFVTLGTHPNNQRAQAFYAGLGFAVAAPFGPRFRMVL